MRKLLLFAFLVGMAGMVSADWGNVLNWGQKRQLVIASLNLPPIAGTWYFADMKSGNESSDGTTPDDAVCSLQTAVSKMVSGRGDGVCLLADSTTYVFPVSKPCSVKAMGATLIGVSNGNPFFNRAKIIATGHSAALGVRNALVVTVNNVQIINLMVSNEDSAGVCGLKVSSGRFYAKNSHFLGGVMTGAKQGDSAVSCGIMIDNVSEGRVDDCIFGSNSTDRNPGSDQGDIYFESAAGLGQWVFNRCITYAQSDDVNHAAIKLGVAATMNGWVTFNDCVFNMWYAGNNGTITGTSVVRSDANQTNAGLIFNRCAMVGYLEWDGDETDCSFTILQSPTDSTGFMKAR